MMPSSNRAAERTTGPPHSGETTRTTVTVDIADFQVTDDPTVCLATYALGSCIAVMLYDPVVVAAGMIHFMLPLSKASPDKAELRPAMFADTGIPRLFEAMYALGCNKRSLVVKVAGGGALYDDHGVFAIGRRNYTILRKLFWKNGINIAAEDVGGSASRSVWLYTVDGRVVIKSGGTEVEL